MAVVAGECVIEIGQQAVDQSPPKPLRCPHDGGYSQDQIKVIERAIPQVLGSEQILLRITSSSV